MGRSFALRTVHGEDLISEGNLRLRFVCGGGGEGGLIFGRAYVRGWERGVGLLLEFYGIRL